MTSHFRPIESFHYRFKYKQTQIGRIDNDSFLLDVALDCVFIFYSKYSSISSSFYLKLLRLWVKELHGIYCASDSGYQQASKRKPRHHLISGRRRSYKHGNFFNTSRLLQWWYTFLWQITRQTKIKQIWADTEKSRDVL